MRAKTGVEKPSLDQRWRPTWPKTAARIRKDEGGKTKLVKEREQ